MIDMIEEVGTVIDLRDGGRIALVQCHKPAACDKCSTVAMCRSGDSGLREIEAINHAKASRHDQVRLVISSRKFLRSSFILYILPLVGLLAGAGLGYQFSTLEGMTTDPELLMAVTAVGGLVGVFMLIFHLNRRLNREDFMPIIVSIHMRKPD